MKPSTAYPIGGIVFIVCIALALYYLIPGVYHVLADPPMARHVKYALVFCVVAVLAAIGAHVAANSKTAA